LVENFLEFSALQREAEVIRHLRSVADFLHTAAHLVLEGVAGVFIEGKMDGKPNI
jgi:hypothetical protein